MGIRNKEQTPRYVTMPRLSVEDGTICRLLGKDYEDMGVDQRFEVLKLELRLIEVKQKVEDGDYRDEQAFFRTEALWAIADALNANKDGLLAISDALGADREV